MFGNRQCRFCLSSDDEKGDLIQPCDCKGTMSYVHRDCLRMWREHCRGEAAEKCTVCGAQYHDYEPDKTISDVLDGMMGLSLLGGVLVIGWKVYPLMARQAIWLRWHWRFFWYDLYLLIGDTQQS
eukprot:gnl/MRDRNA2_/MRDRNA2_290685_c0_seq1.p1 gnl/MRDRNA2_/MRDRNA2_290685_c0~~gnl/MRDRNA2_/MRDRNA2_290685_c0_seq1.p1  ORF type:complete len:125 (-),score=5.78 gnl/MRDRNA2_/MRDRNA2_290685_c0_seq1:535-909(-)